MTRFALLSGLGLASANPMTLVLDELAKLVSENTENLKLMEVNFAESSTQCKMTLSQTADRIKGGEASIQSLSAKVSSHRSSQEAAAGEAEKTTTQIAQLEMDLKKYNEQLAAKRAEFQAASDKLEFTVGQVDKAIDHLSAKTKDIPAANLVQLSTSSTIPMKVREHLTAFIQLAQAPQASSYEFESSSGGVIDMLKGLLASFKKQQHENNAEALNTKHNSNILIQQTQHELEGANTYLQDKKDLAGVHGSKAGAAAAEKEAAETALKEDKTLLSETQRSCQKAANEYKADVTVMSSEVDACKQVSSILSDGGAQAYEASGANDDGSLRQSTQLTSLLQQSSRSALNSEGIVDMLRGAGEKLHSRVLNLAATRIAMLETTKAVSFEAINNMIRDMINKLEEEAALESGQHDKCEGAKDINKANTEQSVRKLEGLNADQDENTALVSKNGATAKKMASAIQDLTTQRTNAEQERTKENEVNTKIIAESTAAEAALSQARSVVDEFMGQDIGVATRGPSPAMDRIAVLLEKIQENSSVTMVKTKQLEDDAKKDYETFMKDSEASLASSKEQKRIAEQNEAKYSAELVKIQESLKEENAMHKSLLDELAQITQLCNPSLSPEERQKKRAEEIQNLENALKAIEPRLD